MFQQLFYSIVGALSGSVQRAEAQNLPTQSACSLQDEGLADEDPIFHNTPREDTSSSTRRSTSSARRATSSTRRAARSTLYQDSDNTFGAGTGGSTIRTAAKKDGKLNHNVINKGTTRRTTNNTSELNNDFTSIHRTGSTRSVTRTLRRNLKLNLDFTSTSGTGTYRSTCRLNRDLINIPRTVTAKTAKSTGKLDTDYSSTIVASASNGTARTRSTVILNQNSSGNPATGTLRSTGSLNLDFISTQGTGTTRRVNTSNLNLDFTSTPRTGTDAVAVRGSKREAEQVDSMDEKRMRTTL